MKTRTKTLLAALMLFALSCKKENTTVQSTGVPDESAIQALSSDASELAANAVKIGTQVWRKKNLDVRYYRNGDCIPQVKGRADWAGLTTGAWCWYKNDSANGAVYGKLYNWYAVSDPRGLAPEGWHIPSDAEWTQLSTYLGGEEVAGGKMKSTGTIEAGTGLWYEPNSHATNKSGFTGLPGGFSNPYRTFYGVGSSGEWWSSTEYSTDDAWYRSLDYYVGDVIRFSTNKRYGFSVRCLRD